MKRLLGLLVAGCLASAAPSVSAATLTFTDSVGPNLHLCLSASAPTACNGAGPSIGNHTFTLDVLADGFVANSPITSATLEVGLSDDGGSADGSEKINILVDGNPVVSHADANHGATLDLTGLAPLLADGLLVVQLVAHTGDFFFESARLTVVDDPLVDRAPAVPAPAALWLVGSGVAALGVAVRRRARQA